MYKLQISLVPTNQQLEQQLLSLPPPSINYFIMQQLLESQASTVPWCDGFYGWPFYAAPVYQGMAQEYQHPSHWQYRAPNSGPLAGRTGEHRPFYAAPVYQGMAQEYQHPSHWQYRAPSSGPLAGRTGEHRPFYAAPVYQGMAQEYQHPSHYRAPSSGPSRAGKHRIGFRKAETLYPNHYRHESSETVAEDRSTGIHPGHARIGANDNTRVGKVWRTPSKNPIDS
jgi:hypothetical protein